MIINFAIFLKRNLAFKSIEIPLCLSMQQKIVQESNFLVIPDKEDGNALIINIATSVFTFCNYIYFIGESIYFCIFFNSKLQNEFC